MQIIKDKFIDKRGSLYTIYDDRDPEYKNIKFVQDKISRSYYGTIRGFHGDDVTYKLITCIYGVLDLVLFDMTTEESIKIRLDSNSLDNTSVLVKPKILNAHQCLSSECVLMYKWSEYYNLDNQVSIYYNDPVVNPQWIKTDKLIVSDRDLLAENFLSYKESVINFNNKWM